MAPMIYDLAADEQKTILESQYGVSPFIVKTITLERIFIDKLFAAESYVRKSKDVHRAFEAAKHIYDLAVLENHPKIVSLLSNHEQMKYLLDIRMEEEKMRLDGIPGVCPNEFTFFDEASENSAVRSAYEIMQRQYVLRANDRIPFNIACEGLSKVKEKLQHNTAWHECVK